MQAVSSDIHIFRNRFEWDVFMRLYIQGSPPKKWGGASSDAPPPEAELAKIIEGAKPRNLPKRP